MNRAVWLIAFLFWAPSAVADWKSFGRSDRSEHFANADRIDREGEFARIWHLVNYAQLQSLAGGADWFSSIEQREFNCRTGESRLRSLTNYSEPMGRGRVTYTVSPDSPRWGAMPPETIGESLREIACAEPSRP
jgi:hypothetical protein